MVALYYDRFLFISKTLGKEPLIMDAITRGSDSVTINSQDGRLILVGNGGTFSFGKESDSGEIVAGERLYSTILTIQEFVQKKWAGENITAKGVMAPFVITCKPLDFELVDGLKKDNVVFQLKLHNGRFVDFQSLNPIDQACIAYEYMHRLVHSWAPSELTNQAKAVHASLTDILYVIFQREQLGEKSWCVKTHDESLTLSEKITLPCDEQKVGTLFFQRHALGRGFYLFGRQVADFDKALTIWWKAFRNHEKNNFIEQTLSVADGEEKSVFESWQELIGQSDRRLFDVIQRD